jgi:hypothetical protein
MVAPARPPPNHRRYSVAGIVVVVLGGFVLIGLIGAVVDDGADAESPRAVNAAETSATAPPPTTDPPAPEPGFGNGSFLVGTDSAPGLYRTDGTGDCYWERLSDLTGDLDAILANDRSVGQVYVDVLPTDVAFPPRTAAPGAASADSGGCPDKTAGVTGCTPYPATAERARP